MLVALALITAVHAAEVVPDPAHLAALATAEALAADEEDAAALATLEWLLAQDPSAAVRDPAVDFLESLDSPAHSESRLRRGWGPRTRMVGWEAAVGATMLGGLMYYPAVEGAPALLPVGVLAGGVLGGFSPRMFETLFPITSANTTALVGAQQLAMFNLAAGSLLLDDDGRALPAGLVLGGLLGTAGGAALATAGIGDGPAAAAHAGAFWGMGFAMAGLTVAYAWDEDVTLGSLVAGANLGAVGGWALGHFAGLSREEVRMANFGAVFGAGAAYAFGWATEDSILWTDGGVAVLLSAGAVLGGWEARWWCAATPTAIPSRAPESSCSPVPTATSEGGPALALVNARF